MGILPLEFLPGDNVDKLGLSGEEVYDIQGLTEANLAASRQVRVVVRSTDGTRKEFVVRVRIDTPRELEYYRHGGILPYVLRSLLNEKA
jgi:aconitate hydratase